MSTIGFAGSTLVFVVSFVLSVVVLAYRSASFPTVRRVVDRWQRRLTGRSDWSWLRLWHLLLPLAAITLANVAWNVSVDVCSDDAFAIFASGHAALLGHDPFTIEFCSHPFTTAIPYGLAAVSLNALGALAGSILGIWLVWQLFALSVIPLVWKLSGESRRSTTVFAAVSLLYLPNIATNLGVDNTIVAVSVLVMLYALTLPRRGRTAFQVLAAFLSTARFPAVFPLLGSSASLGRRKWVSLTVVVAVFLGAVGLSWALWGWDAIQVVYLGQFSRANSESLNLFALVLTEGWVRPSLVTAAVQGGALLLLVLFVHARRYSPLASCAVPLVGVMILSQYLNYHFVAWLIPLVLLGTTVNWWLLAYATIASLDESLLYGYLALGRGIWWPYELCGVLLFALMMVVLVTIIRDEEARLRALPREGAGPPPVGPRTPGTGTGPTS